MPRSEAITPPSSTLIWATEDPKIAGSISRPARLTPSWAGLQRGLGSLPMRARNGTWKASCTTPATNTA